MQHLSELLQTLNQEYPHRVDWIPRHQQALDQIETILREGLDGRMFFLRRFPTEGWLRLGHLEFDTLGQSTAITIGGLIDVPNVIYFSVQKLGGPWNGMRSGTRSALILAVDLLVGPNAADEVSERLCSLITETTKGRRPPKAS